MHFEQISLEKVKEQIASGEISLMPASEGDPDSWESDSVKDRFQPGEGSTMKTGEESWIRCCDEARREQDPEKLLKLVQEIDRLLEEKQQAIKGHVGR